MKNLEERQREMRERNLAANTDAEVEIAIARDQIEEDSSDVPALKKRVAEHEKREGICTLPYASPSVSFSTIENLLSQQ